MELPIHFICLVCGYIGGVGELINDCCPVCYEPDVRKD